MGKNQQAFDKVIKILNEEKHRIVGRLHYELVEKQEGKRRFVQTKLKEQDAKAVMLAIEILEEKNFPMYKIDSKKLKNGH